MIAFALSRLILEYILIASELTSLLSLGLWFELPHSLMLLNLLYTTKVASWVFGVLHQCMILWLYLLWLHTAKALPENSRLWQWCKNKLCCGYRFLGCGVNSIWELPVVYLRCWQKSLSSCCRSCDLIWYSFVVLRWTDSCWDVLWGLVWIVSWWKIVTPMYSLLQWWWTCHDQWSGGALLEAGDVGSWVFTMLDAFNNDPIQNLVYDFFQFPNLHLVGLIMVLQCRVLDWIPPHLPFTKGVFNEVFSLNVTHETIDWIVWFVCWNMTCRT